MAGWVLPLLLCGLHIVAPARAFSVLYNNGQQGRKLFGGYRIVPRACKPSSMSPSGRNDLGVCMFNYECSQRSGDVVGACMDGFLFGACCRLPPGVSFPVDETDELDQESLITSQYHENNSPPSTAIPPTRLPAIMHPEADTILVHQNGSAVLDMDNPEDLFRPSTIILPGNSIQDTDIIYEPTTITNRPVFSTFNYVTKYSPVYTSSASSSPASPSSSLYKDDTTEGKHTTFSYVTNYDSVNNLNSQTTRPYPDRITMSRPFISTHYGTTKPASTVAFRPKPSYLTTTQKPSTHSVESETDNLVLIPTLSTEKRPGFTNADQETATNSDSINPESINHILSLLNDSNPEYADPEPEPVPHFPPPAFPQPEPIPHFPPPTNLQPEPVPHFPPPTNSQPEPIPHFSPPTNPQPEPITHFPPPINSLPEPIPHFPPPTNTGTGGFSTWVSVDEQMTTSSTYRPQSTVQQSSSATSSINTPGIGLQVIQEDEKISSQSIPTYQQVPMTTRPQTKPPAPTVIVLSPLSSDFTTTNIPASQSIPPRNPIIITSTTSTTSKQPDTTLDTDQNWTQYPLITTKPLLPSSIVTKQPTTEQSTIVTSLTSLPSSTTITNRPTTIQSTQYFDIVQPMVPLISTSNRPVVVTLRPSSSQTLGDTNIPVTFQETTFVTRQPPTPSSTVLTSTPSTTRPIIITGRPSTTISTTPSTTMSTTPSTTVTTPSTTISTTPSTTTTTTPLNSNLDAGPSTSLADLSNFPPVRNPQLNMSFAQNQQEAPGIFYVTELPPLTTDTVMVEEEELLENEITTPAFIEDDKLNNKIQSFVNKIVQSLQGNFEDLENVVYNRKNQTSSTIIGTTTKRPFSTLTTPKRPGSTTTRRPTRPPLNNPTGTTVQVTSTTRRPTPSRRPTVRPTSRPTAKPTARPTARPTQRPLSTQTARPQATRPRPPTTLADSSTTKRPARPSATTTKRPIRPSTTTKRPRPTKRSTTTSSTTNLILAVEEESTEQISTKPATVKVPTTTLSTTTTTKTTTPSPTSTTTEEGSTLEDDTTAVTSTSKPVDYRHECGVRPLMKKGGRIVGGKGATFGSWPWQALVRESTWLGLFTKNKCGGVLITSRFVTTAAHCQPGFLANLVAVLGEFDLSGELESKRSVTKNVKRVIVHRNYDAATFANDLALLELDSPVTFDQHIVPICMPMDSDDFTGRMATVSGWGRLKYGGGVPSVLQEVQVPVIENSVCQEMFQTAGHQKVILNSFLCAGYANGQKDSCEGDSGGPLMLERPDGRWVLVGTVSHGIKCAAPYLPGVYMRTTYYKPWLSIITGVK